MRVRGGRAAVAEGEVYETAPARRFATWLPAALIVGGIVFELATPPAYTAVPFLSAAPLIAAPFSTLRVTLAIVAASVGAALGLMVVQGLRYAGEAQTLTELATACTVGLLAIATNRMMRRSERRLASARVIAEAAQRAVLPTPAARLGGLRIAARYQAAQAEARIGGDLYAVQGTPYGARVLVADIRGKGLEAVEAVVIVLGAFREAAEQEATLAGVAGRLDRALRREAERRASVELREGFATAVLVEVPPGEATLRLLNRGHPAPLLLRADGGAGYLEPTAPALPLGMTDLGEWPDLVDERPFPVRATLLLFTDGVTEARDRHGEFYEPAERLRGHTFAGPDALLDALIADVARHARGRAADDMAVLAVHRPSSAEEPAG
nr:PP2C family protein-serine/threonine phosphatase [Streptomyces sp. SAJ15]